LIHGGVGAPSRRRSVRRGRRFAIRSGGGSRNLREPPAKKIKPLSADSLSELHLHPVVVGQERSLQLDDLGLQLLRRWGVEFIGRVNLGQGTLSFIEASLQQRRLSLHLLILKCTAMLRLV
jgi:hypothetical protein